MKRNARFVTVAAVALTAAIALAGCSSSSTPKAGSTTKSSASTATGELASIEKAGVIKVGMAEDPPFVLQGTDGSWSSFNPTLVNEYAKQLGVKVQFVATTGTAMVAGLQAGQYDMIGSSISATPARMQAIDFSNPYAYGGNTWLVKKSSSYKTIADLDSPSVTIAFTAATFQATSTASNMPKAKVRALPGASYADLVSEVTAGTSNAIAIPSFLASALVTKYPSLKSIPGGNKGVDATGVAWGIPKGESSLKASLNSFLAAQKKSGALGKLYAKDITVANALK